MFDQLKKIAELKKIQDSLKKEKSTSEINGVVVEMNGSFDVVDIRLNPELIIEDQEKALKECLNNVKNEIQKKMAQVMMNSGISL